MGVRDAIVLNTTGSNFEAIQSNDTVRIKGDNSELLSLRNDSGTTIFKVDTSDSSVTMTGNITGSANLSGSATTSGSFGRFDGTLFVGDGNDSTLRATLPRNAGTVTGSAQMADDISGSFTSGFNYEGTISGCTVTAGGTWSAGGALSCAQTYAAVAGDKNASILAMGTPSTWPAPSIVGSVDNNEEYNGTSWSEANNNNTARYRSAAAGTQTDSVFFGGVLTPPANPAWYGISTGATEIYNGTNFSEVNDMIIPRRAHMGAGLTGNAALAIGGYDDSGFGPQNPSATPSMDENVEVWNGTNWADDGQVPVSVRRGAAAGSTESAIVFGTNFNKTETYEWNGSSWSEGGTNHQSRQDVGGGGTQNDAISFGGWPTNNVGTCAQNYDGTTWSITGALINNRSRGGMGANQGKASTAHRAGGGASPASYGACGETEEYTGGVGGTVSFGDIKATTLKGNATNISSSLYAGSTVVSGSPQIASDVSGSFTSGFEFSGVISGSVNSSGSFGRVVADFFTGDACFISTSISIGDNIISGSAQLAADISGAFDSGFEYSGSIEVKPSEWDSWSTHQPLITGRAALGGKGNRNAAIAAGGVGNYAAPHSEADQMGHYFFSGVAVTCTEEWNGTSWTEVNDMIDASSTGYGGTTEAGYAMGRSYPLHVQTEEWNGTNWSEGPDVNAGSAGRRSDAGGCSPSQIYLIGGYGSNGQPYFTTFNGTNFSAEPNMTSVFHYGRNGHSGNASSALAWSSSCRKSNGDCTNLWNGSSWSEVAALPKIIDRGTGAGTVNDSYAYGGRCATEGGPTYGQHHCDTFLTWDGSAWSEKADIPTDSAGSWTVYGPATGHNEAIGVGAGSSDVFVFGGKIFNHTGNDYMAASASLMYNEYTAAGSFGRVVANTLVGNAVNLSSSFFAGTGTVSSSAQIASDVSGSFTSGFEFSGTISGSSASTGSFSRLDATTFEADATNIASEFFAGCSVLSGSSAGEIASDISGSFISGFGYEGNISVAVGGSWSVAGDTIQLRRATSGFGSTNSAVEAGGNIVNTPSTCTEEWNGSSWAAGNAMPEASTRGGTSGTQTAGLYFGGYGATDSESATYEYNGTNWSETTDLPASETGDVTVGAGSTSEAALAMIGPGNGLDDAYEWNGSNWSEIAAIINTRGRNQGGGESTEAAIVFGGDDTPTCVKTNQTEIWNGSSWSEVADTIHGRRHGAFAGTTNDGLAITTNLFGPAGSYVGGCGVVEAWNGTVWSETTPLINDTSDGAASGRVGIGSLAGGAHAFGGGVFADTASELFSAFINSGSFGRINATSIIGDGAGIADALVSGCGIVSSSAQIAGDISGSFTGGFGYSGSLSSTSGNIITNGGFDADSDWTQKETGWTISAGKAVATNVGYSYTISQNVSEVQTGVEQTFRVTVTISDYSAGTLKWIIGTSGYLGAALTANGTYVQELTVTPSSQKIGILGSSGSFNGKIDDVQVEILNSGTTGSFGSIIADELHGNFINFSQSFAEAKVPVSSSAQIADQISGSFTSGLRYEGNLSGSSTSTGSFGRVGNFERSELIRYVGSAPNWATIVPRSAGIISSSGQIADDISGSFTSGFNYEGNINTGTQTANGTWSVGGSLSQGITYHTVVGDKSDAISAFGATSSWPQAGVNNTNVEKYNGISWSEANDTITARYTGTGAGTSTNAAIFFGGNTPGGYGGTYEVGLTEEYNGTNFSEVNDMIIKRRHSAGAGNSEAALSIGGQQASAANPTCTATMGCNVENWNGTNWSNEGQAPVYMRRHAAGGTTNAAIVFGVMDYKTESYEYNGSSWSEGGAHPSRHQVAGGGSVNDALSFGGFYAEPKRSLETVTYDGTSWSAANDLPARMSDSGEGANQLAASTAISAGGATSPSGYGGSTCTFEWNAGSAGIFSAGLVSADILKGDASGFSGSLDFSGVVSSSTQIADDISGSFTTDMEFTTNTVISASVVTSQDNIAPYYSGSLVGTQGSVRVGGTWSTGGNLNQGRGCGVMWGTKNGAIYAGGAPGSPSGNGICTEQYNGSSWTELNNMTVGATTAGGFGGNTESGLVTGGYNGSNISTTQIWNGTNWSTATDNLRVGSYYNGAGTSVNAGIIFNGYPAACAQEWDGCTWTAIANPNEGAIRNAGTGESPTAAMVAGGDPTPAPMYCRVQIWDGTSWSYVNRLSVGRRYQGMFGTTNDAVVAGGHSFQPHLPDSVKDYPNTPSGNRLTEIWNGNTWSETGNLPAIRSYAAGNGGAGGTDVGLYAGGSPSNTSTYEFENHASSGSFAQFEVQHKGEVEVERFNITGSTFQLPSFSDRDLNFQSLETQESTGSISGSVVREADVKSQLQAGEFFFHSDYNALAFTYLSQSVYSQSFSFVSQSFYTGSENVWTSSIGMVTQSFYSQSVNIRYITGSQV